MRVLKVTQLLTLTVLQAIPDGYDIEQELKPEAIEAMRSEMLTEYREILAAPGLSVDDVTVTAEVKEL